MRDKSREIWLKLQNLSDVFYGSGLLRLRLAMTVKSFWTVCRPIFGYAPIIGHKGTDYSFPFVLTDGEKVVFVPSHEVRNVLLGWKEIEGKEIEVTWYDRYDDAKKFTFQLYNPWRYRGVRATRFVDLRYIREQNELYPICTNGSQWFHLHIDGFLDKKWDEDPRQIVGEIIAGWYGAGDGLFWRRRSEIEVEAFMEIPRTELSNSKYVVEGETSEFIDYEQNFSVLEWFSKGLDEWKEYFHSKLVKKARQDYVYARQRAGVDTRRLMEQNPNVQICIQDSLDVGNCRLGTEDFIKRYGIEIESDGCISVAKLLENKNIDEMLRNFSFQKVVHYKLLDPDK